MQPPPSSAGLPAAVRPHAHWMHPDLRRQLTERHRHATNQKLTDLDVYRTSTEAYLDDVRSRLSRKRKRVEELEAELTSLRTEVDDLSQRETQVKQLLVGVSNQVYYQRSITAEAQARQNHRLRPHRTNAPVAQVDMTSAIGKRYGYDPTVTAEVDGEPAGNVAAAREARPSFPSLDVLTTHAFDLCLPAPMGVVVAQDLEHVRAFLRRYAPLFQWSEELRCVPPPLLFDEPCLMESSSSAAAGCDNAGCAYWHRNQLQHLQRVLGRIAEAAEGMCTQDVRLCDLSKLFTSLRVFVHESTVIDQLCCGVGYVLNRVIALGWHRQLLLLPGSNHGGSEDGSVGWPAPLAASANPAVGAALPLDVIPSREERDVWEVAVTAVAHGSTAADTFTAAPSALSWRCFTRLAGATSEQRRWLASVGSRMYPTSPHLQLAHVLSMLDPGSGSAPQEVVRVCLEAASVLSAQAAAAALTQADTVYSEVAARYIAYMIARCACALATAHAPLAAELLTRALGTGSPAEEGGARTAAGEVAGAHDVRGPLLLLPAAHQNLSVMLAVLEDTGALQGAELLPLADMSDTHLILSTDFPRSGVAGAAVRRLRARLALLDPLLGAGMAPALIDSLQAGVQLSLLHALTRTPGEVEAQLADPPPCGEGSLAAVWLAYARELCVVDGFPAAVKVSTELLSGSGGECACLLVLLLGWHLQSHGVGEPVRAAAARAMGACAQRYGLAGEAIVTATGAHASSGDGGDEEHAQSGARAALAATPPMGVPRVEWVALHILAAMSEEDPHRLWERLLAVPLDGVLGSEGEGQDAAVLLLMARARAAAALGSATAFGTSLEQCLQVCLAAHRQWWSPLDLWSEAVIGLPHWIGLCVYRSIPFLLGPRSAELTREWRVTVLTVCNDLGVLHPLLSDGARRRDGGE